jgi:hypothetical protein
LPSRNFFNILCFSVLQMNPTEIEMFEENLSPTKRKRRPQQRVPKSHLKTISEILPSYFSSAFHSSKRFRSDSLESTNSGESCPGINISPPSHDLEGTPRLPQLDAFFELFSSCRDPNQLYYSLLQFCDPSLVFQLTGFFPGSSPIHTECTTMHGLSVFWVLLRYLHPHGHFCVLDRRVASSVVSHYCCSPLSNTIIIAGPTVAFGPKGLQDRSIEDYLDFDPDFAPSAPPSEDSYDDNHFHQNHSHPYSSHCLPPRTPSHPHSHSSYTSSSFSHGNNCRSSNTTTTTTKTILNIEYLMKFSGTLLSGKKFKETLADLVFTEGLLQLPFIAKTAAPTPRGVPPPSMDFLVPFLQNYLFKQKNSGQPLCPSTSITSSSLTTVEDIEEDDDAFEEYEKSILTALEREEQQQAAAASHRRQQYHQQQHYHYDNEEEDSVHSCNYIMEVSVKFCSLRNKIVEWKMELLSTD